MRCDLREPNYWRLSWGTYYWWSWWRGKDSSGGCRIIATFLPIRANRRNNVLLIITAVLVEGKCTWAQTIVAGEVKWRLHSFDDIKPPRYGNAVRTKTLALPSMAETSEASTRAPDGDGGRGTRNRQKQLPFGDNRKSITGAMTKGTLMLRDEINKRGTTSAGDMDIPRLWNQKDVKGISYKESCKCIFGKQLPCIHISKWNMSVHWNTAI